MRHGQYNNGARVAQPVPCFLFLSSQAERDRQLLKEAGCAAVFEPHSLYHEVEGAGETANVVGRETDHPDAHETYVQVSP